MREAEKASQVAYSQMLNNNAITQTVSVDGSTSLDWTSSIRLEGSQILELEAKLGELLTGLLSPSAVAVVPAIREVSLMLLNLGVRLPFSAEAFK